MENIFFKEYLSNLKDYNRIPKLQIERAISPLLSIFIEALITEFLRNDDALCGDIEMILPEFPLKKENNQSTNIDWLLINKEKGLLLFIELKTASSSFKPDQLKTYRVIEKNIQDRNASFLYEDVKQIRDHSNERGKYDYILDKLKPFQDNFRKINRSSVIYIVPTKIKDNISDAQVLSFSALPEKLDHPYENEWKQLREFFISIDDVRTSANKSRAINQNDFDATLQSKLELISKYYNKIPHLIWFGNTGDGLNPNFQIQFADGTIKPFYSSGKEYTRAPRFELRNLRGPYEIDKLKAK